MNTDRDPEHFYNAIAEHYNTLFPLAPAKVAFCRDFLSPNHQDLLDIGCATGELCVALAGYAPRVTGLDFDERMIEIARREVAMIPNPIKFIADDLRNLHLHFSGTSLDLIFCFGNTLAHLDSGDDISRFIAQTHATLRTGGWFLGQLVNYEHILSQGISRLPLITRDTLSFARTYRFDSADRSITFTGQLEIKESGQTLSNSVRLYPLTQGELREILQKNGFRHPEFFGDFLRAPYYNESGALVFAAQK